MNENSAASLDPSGKIIFDHIYNQPDPRPYYSTLNQYDYRIPGEAAPVFRKLIGARRAAAEREGMSVLDLGCSYGVNAAILKHGLGMGDLYARYASEEAAGLDRGELIARDRDFYDSRLVDEHLEVTGIDVAGRAVDYAVETNMLDNGIAANLETGPLPEEAASAVGAADLVISTGCIGYVRQPTLEKVLAASDGAEGEDAPWMAHFVLRMFPFEAFEEMLAERGYITETLPQSFRQRRFASSREQARVLDNLSTLGLDPTTKEAEGWYHAEFYLSRPAEAVEAMPIERLLRS